MNESVDAECRGARARGSGWRVEPRLAIALRQRSAGAGALAGVRVHLGAGAAAAPLPPRPDDAAGYRPRCAAAGPGGSRSPSGSRRTDAPSPTAGPADRRSGPRCYVPRRLSIPAPDLAGGRAGRTQSADRRSPRGCRPAVFPAPFGVSGAARRDGRAGGTVRWADGIAGAVGAGRGDRRCGASPPRAGGRTATRGASSCSSSARCPRGLASHDGHRLDLDGDRARRARCHRPRLP